MPAFRFLFVVAALLAAGCETPPRQDLRHNASYYRDTGYLASDPGDRAVYVAPVADRRQPPEDPGINPISYLPEHYWERPLTQMVHDVICDELRTSGLFSDVVDELRADVVLVKPTLSAFDGGIQEQPYLRRSVARLGLKLDVYGPEQRDGERPLLMSQPFFDRQLSSAGYRPPSPQAMMGVALHAVMAKLVTTVDAAGLGRTGVPTEADLKRRG